MDIDTQSTEDLFVEYKQCLERYSKGFTWLHVTVNKVEAIDKYEDMNDDWIFGQREV